MALYCPLQSSALHTRVYTNVSWIRRFVYLVYGQLKSAYPRIRESVRLTTSGGGLSRISGFLGVRSDHANPQNHARLKARATITRSVRQSSLPPLVVSLRAEVLILRRAQDERAGTRETGNSRGSGRNGSANDATSLTSSGVENPRTPIVTDACATFSRRLRCRRSQHDNRLE